MRFYRYLIYRLYTWRVRVKDNTPILTVILLLSFVHLAQIMIIYSFVYNFFPNSRAILHFNKTQVIVFSFSFLLLYSFLIYRKKRWENYAQEFKNESPSQKRKGTIWIGLFTIGSVVFLFVCMIILSALFWPSK